MTTSEARGTPAMPLLVSISNSSMVICWPSAELDVVGLGDEHGGEGAIHHRAVEIERIAHRQHEADDLAR